MSAAASVFSRSFHGCFSSLGFKRLIEFPRCAYGGQFYSGIENKHSYGTWRKHMRYTSILLRTLMDWNQHLNREVLKFKTGLPVYRLHKVAQSKAKVILPSLLFVAIASWLAWECRSSNTLCNILIDNPIRSIDCNGMNNFCLVKRFKLNISTAYQNPKRNQVECRQ